MATYERAATYFVERHVENVRKVAEGVEISFANGKIVAHDQVINLRGLKGKMLVSVDYQDAHVTLNFSDSSKVVLKADNYEVEHSVCGRVYPGRQHDGYELPAHPDERVAEGPTGPEEDG